MASVHRSEFRWCEPDSLSRIIHIRIHILLQIFVYLHLVKLISESIYCLVQKLAIVRKEIGYTQAQFGELIGRAWPTVHAIERGKLRLTEEVAQKVSEETGVSLKWLLEDDPETKPYSEIGTSLTPWNKETFEFVQATKQSYSEAPPPYADEATATAIILMVDLWIPIYSAAVKAGKGEVARYHLFKFLRDMCDKFGEDRPKTPAKMRITYHSEKIGDVVKELDVHVHPFGGIHVNIRPLDPNIDCVDYIE